ncbi:MAG: alanine racemase [Acidobacteria bacterium]|nr:MAG: alanine racemase [Acidobacteriota bacterium]
MSRAFLIIKADAIKQNVRRLFEFSGKPLIAVIKANAYGVGMVQIGKLLESLEEVSSLAVACVEEGIELRKAGIRKKILVLGGVLRGEEKAFLDYELTPVVSHREHLRALEGLNIPFQVKYDTGMGRLGFFEEIIEDPRIEGVLSHMSSPLDREFSIKQIERFRRILSHYRNLKMVHMESSASVPYRLNFTTHIRVGLALYGEKPAPNYPIELIPALELYAKLISVKTLPAGYPVSYSRTYMTSKSTRVGVVAFGYADGLMKSLSNKGKLYYKGRSVSIIGNITMDMTMVDFEDIPAEVGDNVQIVGPNQSFSELAKTAGTIPYELMTNLSSRIERVLC